MPNSDKRIGGLRDSLFRYFLLSKRGLRVSDVAGFLVSGGGDFTPWKTLGFDTVEEFLYSQKDMVEARRKTGDKNNYLFLRESYIQPKFKNVRKRVLLEEIDKNMPVFENTTETSIEILMRSVKRSSGTNLTDEKNPEENDDDDSEGRKFFEPVTFQVPTNPLISSTFAISIDNSDKILQFINKKQVVKAQEELRRLDEMIECFQSKVSRYETLCKIKDISIEQFNETKENLLKSS